MSDPAESPTSTAQRRGDWMQTYTGGVFWPLDPHPREVVVADIAHALSMLCRYAGHVRRFYSVAEHCWHMSYAVAPEHALWALLHDATEAYVVDVPRPLKRHLPGYAEIEDRVMEAIASRFGLAGPTPAEIKDADNRILLDERAALLRRCERPWSALAHLAPLGVEIQAWSPEEAEKHWRSRFDELVGGPSL